MLPKENVNGDKDTPEFSWSSSLKEVERKLQLNEQYIFRLRKDFETFSEDFVTTKKHIQAKLESITKKQVQIDEELENIKKAISNIQSRLEKTVRIEELRGVRRLVEILNMFVFGMTKEEGEKYIRQLVKAESFKESFMSLDELERWIDERFGRVNKEEKKPSEIEKLKKRLGDLDSQKKTLEKYRKDIEKHIENVHKILKKLKNER